MTCVKVTCFFTFRKLAKHLPQIKCGQRLTSFPQRGQKVIGVYSFTIDAISAQLLQVFTDC